MSIVTGSPSASSGLYPNNSTALVFQLVIMPLRSSSLMIASSGDSTTDVRSRAITIADANSMLG
jgi:hypothetical protein